MPADPRQSPTSVVAASRPCPECGLEAWVVPALVYDPTNLVQRDGLTLARYAFYRCPESHTHCIPYAEAMTHHGTLGELLDAVARGELK